MYTWLSDPRGMQLACKDEAVHRLAVQVRNADVDRAGAIGCLLDAGASSRSEASYLTSQGTKRPLYFCKASAYCALPGACTCYIHGRLVHQYPRSRKPDTDTIPRAAQRRRQAQCGCARRGEGISVSVREVKIDLTPITEIPVLSWPRWAPARLGVTCDTLRLTLWALDPSGCLGNGRGRLSEQRPLVGREDVHLHPVDGLPVILQNAARIT